jgi:hypothetical protein
MSSSPACGVGGNWWKFVGFIAGVNSEDKAAISGWLREHGLTDGTGSASGLNALQHVETYPYVDEEGRLLYEVVRLIPKGFRQRRPDGNGGWVWNMQSIRRVLFRLPEVRKATRIFIVEGEKDVIALGAIAVIRTSRNACVCPIKSDGVCTDS